MKLLINKHWEWYDIALLKWSAFLFGVVAGGYFSSFIRDYLLLLLPVAVILAIRPAMAYFRD
jgi:uncharacterized membrane protein YoaK (UPF0700 family)